jgi:hypothetical protein
MAQCYFLAVCAGSSVDQQTNNATLFNLVEQVNVPPGAPPPPNGMLPLEMHAYLMLTPEELASAFEIRFVMVAESGLETPSEAFSFRSPAPRFRTRTVGLPFPPVTGSYELRLDFRGAGQQGWARDPARWPITITEVAPAPRVTH